MKPLFALGDDAQLCITNKGFKVGKIVDKLQAHHKPDLFIIQKWKLFKYPLNRSNYDRWIVEYKKKNGEMDVFVFPENPKRIMLFTVYLSNDVRVEKLVSEAEYRKAYFAQATANSIGGR